MTDILKTLESRNKAETTCKRMDVPTEKEREALAAMKAIKERVRELKKAMHARNVSQNKSNEREVHDITAEMERLKEEWDQWEKKREEAAKGRMVLLGHEDDR